MKTSNLLSSVSVSMSKVGFKLKKHSPEILITVGVIGTVASTILACKATRKIDDILDETKKDVNIIHNSVDDPDIPEELYTEEDRKKDLVIVYTQTAVKVAKLYAPAVALGALSISCLVTSHKILSKRNAAIAAAYMTVDKGFKEYRSNVVDRYGEDIDRELKYGIKAKKVERTEVDENGKKKKIKETIQVIDGYSDYAVYFDESNGNYQPDSEYNLMFLRSQQQYANDKLRAKGYLFLNDVLGDLGYEETKASRVVGWVYDPKNEDGDNYIDFGMFEVSKENEDGSLESVILLDFNVDGNIWELM